MQKRQEINQQIVREGFRLLEAQWSYTQATVLRKLERIECKVSPASFSNMLSGERPAGKKALETAAQGMREIVARELGYQFDDDRLTFDTGSRPGDWQPQPVTTGSAPTTDQPPFTFYPAGRLTIQQKVEFINSAQHEVIELGVRLNTFTNYFLSRSRREFRMHIENLLANNVNLKLYLLDPESNVANLYFNDRVRHQKSEAKSIQTIREVIERLRLIQEQLLKNDRPGKLQVFSYKHIPYAHFLIIDGDRRYGKLMTSPYLYATPRADCPVLEVHRPANPDLFKRYWSSFKAMAQDARQLELNGG